MKMFLKVFLIVMGILNILGGFVTGQILNMILGTIFIVMVFVHKRIK